MVWTRRRACKPWMCISTNSFDMGTCPNPSGDGNSVSQCSPPPPHLGADCFIHREGRRVAASFGALLSVGMDVVAFQNQLKEGCRRTAVQAADTKEFLRRGSMDKLKCKSPDQAARDGQQEVIAHSHGKKFHFLVHVEARFSDLRANFIAAQVPGAIASPIVVGGHSRGAAEQVADYASTFGDAVHVHLSE